MRSATGCKVAGGVDALITLVDGTPTVGAGAGVGTLITLGGGAGVGVLITLGGGASIARAGVGRLGGPPLGRLKMVRRVSTASSLAFRVGVGVCTPTLGVSAGVGDS